MNESTVTLLYLGSKAIERYISRHPVTWTSKNLSQLGGIADKAGVTPTPSVYEFFSLVAQKQGLFTQEEYRDHCFERWETWDKLQDKAMREAIAAKLFRNFYPSMVNTLHAWALLVEAGWFDLCVIDSFIDAFSKHDLIVSRTGCTPIALDLFIQTTQSVSDRQYKLSHRKSSRDFVCQAFDVPLPINDRPQKRPGNMRWYCLKDFEPIYTTILDNNTLWDTPYVPCTCGYHMGKGKLA